MATSASGLGVRELSDQRRHFLEFTRPGGEVVLQPFDHVETGLDRVDELSLRHRGKFMFEIAAVHCKRDLLPVGDAIFSQMLQLQQDS